MRELESIANHYGLFYPYWWALVSATGHAVSLERFFHPHAAIAVIRCQFVAYLSTIILAFF